MIFFTLLTIVTGAQVCLAEEVSTYTLIVKEGKFFPDRIEVNKDKKFKLEIKNDGETAEEFESVELNREKIVPPHKSITIFLGPLNAGEYAFFGDFHPETAKGKIIVK